MGEAGMPIKLIRLDDRYIHGQVTVGWVKHYGINEIWVIDDKLAKDTILKELQKSLAPPETFVEILSVVEAIEKLKRGDHNRPNSNIMIIVSDAVTCLKIIKEANINIDWINVGQSAWKTGKIIVTKSYAITVDDAQAFKELMAMNIRAVYQMLPHEPPQDFYKQLRKKGLI